MAIIIVRGNVGNVPELKITSERKEFLTFSLYENLTRGGTETRTKYQVSVYNPASKDFCRKYIRKGTFLVAIGKFRAARGDNGATFLHIAIAEVQLIKQAPARANTPVEA